MKTFCLTRIINGSTKKKKNRLPTVKAHGERDRRCVERRQKNRNADYTWRKWSDPLTCPLHSPPPPHHSAAFFPLALRSYSTFPTDGKYKRGDMRESNNLLPPSRFFRRKILFLCGLFRFERM